MATAKGLTSDLLAARDEGLSYSQIGARFGITKQSAHERIARALKAPPKTAPPDVIDIPATIEVKPRPGPALNAAFVAEVYNRHGMDLVRERWPEFTDVALNEAIRTGQRMVALPAEEPVQPLHVRIWRAVKRLFGRS